MPDPVFIFATIRPKPEHFAAAKDAIAQIIPATLAEEGCEVFELYESSDDGKALHLWEKFASEDAVQFHHDQGYTQRVFEAYKEWLAEPVSIKRIAPVAAASGGAA